MKTLSRGAIEEALRTLAQELDSALEPHELVIAGGAALVLLYGARDSTRDVDAVLSDRVVLEAASRVASQLALPEDWLNDGAKGFLHGVALGEILFSAPGLVVRTLAPCQLLAMKLTAWRDDQDIADARLLLSKMAGTLEDVWNQVEPFLVPGRELKARYALEDLWEAVHESE